jgi:hypothetical protein
MSSASRSTSSTAMREAIATRRRVGAGRMAATATRRTITGTYRYREQGEEKWGPPPPWWQKQFRREEAQRWPKQHPQAPFAKGQGDRANFAGQGDRAGGALRQ